RDRPRPERPRVRDLPRPHAARDRAASAIQPGRSGPGTRRGRGQARTLREPLAGDPVGTHRARRERRSYNVGDGSPRRLHPHRRGRGNRRQDPVAGAVAGRALPPALADRGGHPGGDAVQPRARGLAGRAGRVVADPGRPALGGRRQLHRHRAVDAEARQAARGWLGRGQRRRLRRHHHRLLPGRDGRQDPGRHVAVGGQLRSAVASGGRDHGGHAAGQRAGGGARQPLRRSPAAAGRPDHCRPGVPGAGPVGRVPGDRLMRELLSRPDEVMLELGAGGELLVARLRAILSALVLLLPLAGTLTGASAVETVIGFGAAVFINLGAQAWLLLARNRMAHAWLPWVTCAWDIASVTAVLALLAFLDDRVAGVNSMVVWAFYLVAIAMTALRNDGRLTLFAGALAMLLY